MFITKTDKAIGMIVEQTGYKKVGVLLTREINNSPIEVEYYSPQWIAENADNFDKYNSEYVFNLFAEHIKTLGASKEALSKFLLFAPDSVKKYLKPEMAEINKKYEEWKQKNLSEGAMSDTKAKKTKKVANINDAEQKVSADDVKPKKTKNVSTSSSVEQDTHIDDAKISKTKNVSNLKSSKVYGENTDATTNTKNAVVKASNKKSKELFTKDEIEAIKAIKKDEQLLGKNKSDTARRIVIKYYDTKTDDEMLDIARKIWTDSYVQGNLIRWHHNELIEKGVINA